MRRAVYVPLTASILAVIGTALVIVGAFERNGIFVLGAGLIVVSLLLWEVERD